MAAFGLPTTDILLDPVSASDLLGLEYGQRIIKTCNSDSLAGAGGLSGEMNKIKYELEVATHIRSIVGCIQDSRLGS